VSFDYSVAEEKRIKLGKYIRKVREDRNLGHNQFCLKINLQQSLLSRLENGKILKINPFMLKQVAEGLKLDYKELYKIIGYLDEIEDHSIAKPLNASSSLDESLQIPIHGRLINGYGYLNSKYEKKTMKVLNNKNFGENMFAMTVDGSSMEPEVTKGSFLLIDPEPCDFHILDKKIILLKYNDKIYVKKVMIYNDLIILRSFNINYDDIIIKRENLDEIEYLGKVVHALYEKEYS